VIHVVPLSALIQVVCHATGMGIDQIRMRQLGKTVEIARQDGIVTLVFKGSNKLYSVRVSFHELRSTCHIMLSTLQVTVIGQDGRHRASAPCSTLGLRTKAAA
jgi:hypothetical protein